MVPYFSFENLYIKNAFSSVILMLTVKSKFNLLVAVCIGGHCVQLNFIFSFNSLIQQ